MGLISGLGEATSLAGAGPGNGPARRPRGSLLAVRESAGYAIAALAVPAMGPRGRRGHRGHSRRGGAYGQGRSHALARCEDDFGTRRPPWGADKGFALHELMDQIGATLGPLIVSGVLFATGGEYGRALGVMVLPGAAAIAVLAWLRHRNPRPGPIRARRSRFGRHPVSGSEWRCPTPPPRQPVLPSSVAHCRCFGPRRRCRVSFGHTPCFAACR